MLRHMPLDQVRFNFKVVCLTFFVISEQLVSETETTFTSSKWTYYHLNVNIMAYFTKNGTK